MRSDAASVEDYLGQLPEGRRAAITAVRDAVNARLPDGYVETMASGMIAWVVPHEDYPDTYNGQPLMIAALASQKNHMALYLMGLYSSEPEVEWFRQQYADRGMKLDMGKSCVRFTRLDQVPLDVIGEVIAKVPPDLFVERYETARVQGRRRG